MVCADEAATQPATQPTTLETLLRNAGIDPRDVGIQERHLRLMVGQPPPSELARLLMCEPLRADAFGHVLAEALVASATQSPLDLLAEMSRYNGRLVRRGLVGEALAAQRTAAEKDGALADVLRRCGATEFTPEQLAEVPASVQKAAAVILLTALDSVEWVRRSQRGADAQFWQRVRARLARPLTAEEEPAEPEFDGEFKRVVERFPNTDVVIAAEDLLMAIGFAVQGIRADETLKEARFDVRIATPLGHVILADAGAQDRAAITSVLLSIDLGGDDRYTAAGASDLEHPVSVSLDFDGHDTYLAGESPTPPLASCGAGVFGVGLLWDAAGNDRYEAQRFSQGAGYFGVGVLIDNTGDDTYTAIAASQASATAGFGVLIDRAGHDRYESFLESQAFAGPNAVAVLVDLAGDDRYVANDTEIRFPSSQNPQHNNSMSQGAATGWRADYLDGYSVPGGVGVLVDAGGDDEYTCGLFGQGAGYWYGLGLLIDLSGRDRYTGHWYVQGAAAHYAAGVLLDRAGDDQYTANQNMSQGAGHDLSVGVLIDDAGDDVYLGTTLGLGASNAAGVGVFLDQSGADQYRTPPGDCLGWANANQGFRSLFPSFGLFCDLGGEDTYAPRVEGQPTRTGAGNGRWWSCPPDPRASTPYLFGFGFDTGGAAAAAPNSAAESR